MPELILYQLESEGLRICLSRYSQLSWSRVVQGFDSWEFAEKYSAWWKSTRRDLPFI